MFGDAARDILDPELRGGVEPFRRQDRQGRPPHQVQTPTAWSKGLAEALVVSRHALKNAFIPVVTIVGLQIPILIGGTVIIEQIFMLPGMGRLIVESLLVRDYPVVMGIMLFFSIGLMLTNLVVDLTYGFLDPRIRSS